MTVGTHTNQSTAQSRETSSTGTSIAVSTINISTRAALGTLALAILAAVEVNLVNKMMRGETETSKTYTTVT